MSRVPTFAIALLVAAGLVSSAAAVTRIGHHPHGAILHGPGYRGAGMPAFSSRSESPPVSIGNGSYPAYSGSGWHLGGWGGTLNPGWGYNFGPHLGGIGGR